MVKPRETTWSDLKAELAQFDRTGLLGLLKDLYSLRPENSAFIAARLGVSGDPLALFRKNHFAVDQSRSHERAGRVSGKGQKGNRRVSKGGR